MSGQPLNEIIRKNVEAHQGQTVIHGGVEQVEMKKMLGKFLHTALPALGLQPRLKLPRRRLAGALTSITDDGDAGFDQMDIAAFDRPCRCPVPDGNAALFVEPVCRGDLAPALLAVHLAEKHAPRRHHGRITGIDLIAQSRVGIGEMAPHASAFIGIDEFLVAGERGSPIERNTVSQCRPDHSIGFCVFLGHVRPLEVIGAAEIDVFEDAKL